MIVEDYEDTRAILRALLTYHNYEVVEEQTAEAMLEHLDEAGPDAIVLQCGSDGVLEDPQSKLALSNNAHVGILEALRAEAAEPWPNRTRLLSQPQSG